MIEIKFNQEKKKNKKRKTETSKKLAWFSGICFALSLIYSMTNTASDAALPMTMITVTGAVFGITMVAYNSKSRYENVTKIQQNYLREKYIILQEIGVLDYNRAILELEEEFAEMEENADNERDLANEAITYNG
jgi:hypothetical protein